jgi:7-carboxy-7-deazaguanine synthase
MDAATILTECQKLRKETGAMNVCLTGGEPFLQPKQDLHELCILLNNDQFSIECFSNGSLLYPQWAEDQIMFVMDWKLPGSGEETRGLECRHRNVQYLANAFNAYHRQAVKFTIKDRNDFDHAVKAWRYWVGSTELQTFAGVVWGALDNATLAQWILDAKMPWRLNVQVHNHIWDRNQRGI